MTTRSVTDQSPIRQNRMPTTIPAKFLYYKESKCLYAEVTATQGADGVYELAYTPTQDKHQGSLASVNGESVWGNVKIKTASGSVVSKRMYTVSTLAKNLTTGEEIRLLSFSSPSAIFGPYVLRVNKFLYHVAPATTIPTTVSPAVAVTAQAPAPSMVPLSVPKPIKKKVTTVGDLNPFVAKQLLELAQNKHDMCPIVAEEFAAGHTAAMPCGHLFADFAIKETFKKEPNKCPVCRVYGSPTYV